MDLALFLKGFLNHHPSTILSQLGDNLDAPLHEGKSALALSLEEGDTRAERRLAVALVRAGANLQKTPGIEGSIFTEVLKTGAPELVARFAAAGGVSTPLDAHQALMLAICKHDRSVFLVEE